MRLRAAPLSRTRALTARLHGPADNDSVVTEVDADEVFRETSECPSLPFSIPQLGVLGAASAGILTASSLRQPATRMRTFSLTRGWIACEHGGAFLVCIPPHVTLEVLCTNS